MFSGKDDKDEFWNIEKLIPRKKGTASPFSTGIKTVEVRIDGEEKTEKSKNTITVLTTDTGECETVSYERSEGLIKSVKIRRMIDKYDFYGNFRKAALLYYDFKTPKCDFAPFYSYMPQYSQFNFAQKSYYFYWRDCVRRGKYIKTDYSYLYLYVYEVLNLPDKISKEDGIRILCELWKAYRKELPNIDSNMSLWVQDYCLVYNLPTPMEYIGDFVFDVIGAAQFKEFYLSDYETSGESGIGAMLAYLSDYDWRRGKYAGGDNKEVYRKHLLGAMGAFIRMLFARGEISFSSGELVTLERSAFKNSLCTHSVKCHLTIEYLALSQNDGVRLLVSSAVKYTENKLRALLGVKSRLAVKDLNEEYKKIIDEYFDVIFEAARRERIKAAMPEYEKLYDAAEEGISFAGAAEIERSSWSTTARLIVESEDSAVENEKSDIETDDTIIPGVISQETDCYGLSALEVDFLRAISSGNSVQLNVLVKKIGMPADAIADRINEAFADGFGDVIIEGSYPEFHIIEDYKEETEEWLRKLTK